MGDSATQGECQRPRAGTPHCIARRASAWKASRSIAQPKGGVWGARTRGVELPRCEDAPASVRARARTRLGPARRLDGRPPAHLAVWKGRPEEQPHSDGCPFWQGVESLSQMVSRGRTPKTGRMAECTEWLDVLVRSTRYNRATCATYGRSRNSRSPLHMRRGDATDGSSPSNSANSLARSHT